MKTENFYVDMWSENQCSILRSIKYSNLSRVERFIKGALDNGWQVVTVISSGWWIFKTYTVIIYKN